MAEERAVIEAENSRIASEIATLTAANGNLAAVNHAAEAHSPFATEIARRCNMSQRASYGHRRRGFTLGYARRPASGRIRGNVEG